MLLTKTSASCLLYVSILFQLSVLHYSLLNFLRELMECNEGEGLCRSPLFIKYSVKVSASFSFLYNSLLQDDSVPDEVKSMTYAKLQLNEQTLYSECEKFSYLKTVHDPVVCLMCH